MSRFTIWIVQPLLDTAPQCFIEVATGIAYSLRQLGHEVDFCPGQGPYISNPLPSAIDNTYGRLIVFNANRLPDMPIPADAIIFNSEQVQTEGEWGTAWQTSAYLKLLRRHLVWDYSHSNINSLNRLGVERAVYCGIGYYPGLSNIPAAKEDLDVLFVGSSNDRRVKLLNEIAKYRMTVRALTGVYGEERNRWISRAKVVLNIHYYPQPVWEIFRVSYLLANKKCVVTENSGVDTTLELLASNTTAYVAYEKIVETCFGLVANANLRKEIAERGFAAFSQIDQVNEVKQALEASRI